jgi:long-subunit acyl-CoA synthetase (AMP-forming)
VFLKILIYFRNSTKIGGDHIALAVKRENNWVKWTYNEYLADVEAAAKAFIKLGLEPRSKGVADGRILFWLDFCLDPLHPWEN